MPYLFFFLYVKVTSLTIETAEGLLQLSRALCIPCIHLPCQHSHHRPPYKHFDQSIIRLLQQDHHYEVSAGEKLSPCDHHQGLQINSSSSGKINIVTEKESAVTEKSDEIFWLLSFV